MSDLGVTQGYLPEDHAPDPVISHGDPTAPGKIAIWLFLASEIMFFLGVLGSYIILRSGSPTLFAKHAEVLSKPLAGINTIVLILSSVTMYIAVDAAHAGKRNRVIGALVCTFLCACGFMGIKSIEYYAKFTHYTVVARESTGGPLYVYDGHLHHEGAKQVLVGYRTEISNYPHFNINLISEADVKASSKQEEEKDFVLPAEISQMISYGPWKNVFYACYFTATGIHGLHVIGGMIPIGILCVLALRGRLLPAHTEYVGLYWHFVDLVWIFLFPLLYLI